MEIRYFGMRVRKSLRMSFKWEAFWKLAKREKIEIMCTVLFIGRLPHYAFRSLLSAYAVFDPWRRKKSKQRQRGNECMHHRSNLRNGIKRKAWFFSRAAEKMLHLTTATPFSNQSSQPTWNSAHKTEREKSAKATPSQNRGLFISWRRLCHKTLWRPVCFWVVNLYLLHLWSLASKPILRIT